MSFFTKHGNTKFVGDWKIGDTEYSLLQTVKPIFDAGVFSIKTAPEGEAITGGVTLQAGTGCSFILDKESKTITLNTNAGLSTVSTGIGLEGTGKEDSPLKVNLSAYHVGNQVISLRSNTGISLQGRTNEAEGPRLSLENDWEFSGGTTPTFKSVDRFTIELMSGGSDKEWPTLRAQGFSSGSYRNYLLLEEDGSIPSNLIPKMSLNTSVGITGNGTTENPLKINLNNLSLDEIVSITAPSFNFNSKTSILFSIGNGQTFGLTAGDVTNDNQLETVFHVRDEGISLLAHGLSYLKLEAPTLDKLLLSSNLGTNCAANTAGGLVVVGGDGKIPSSLLPAQTSTTIPVTDGTTTINATKITIGDGLEVVAGENGEAVIQRKRRTAIEFTSTNLTSNKLTITDCMVGDFVVVDADGVMVIPVIQQIGNDVQIDFTNWTVTGTWKVIFR